MKALVLTEYNHLEYMDVDIPEINDEEVLVRVAACSICGSDVHGYDGSSGRRIPPLIMGHEASGTIEKAGKRVTDFKPGDRVTFNSTVFCGKCFFCKRGEFNLCNYGKVLGVSCGEYHIDGAMAEYIKVPEAILYHLPDKVTFEQAALVEPLSVAIHALKVSPVFMNDRVVVVGAGTIGLLIIQALKVAGCSEIIAIDLDEQKLKTALEVGATCVIQSQKENAKDKVLEKTKGLGADLAFEAVGIAPTFKTAVDAVRKGGNVVMVGNVSKEIPLELQKCVTRQIGLLGSCASAGEYDIGLSLIEKGLINLDNIISVVAPLSEGDKWFKKLHQAEPGIIKIVLKP